MESTVDNRRLTRALGSNLAPACTQQCRVHDAPSHDWREYKSLSCETALLEPAFLNGKEGFLLLMKRVLAVHTVTRTAEDMAGTVVEIYSDDMEHKLQPLSISVAKSLSDVKSESECVLADYGIMTKTDVEAIVERTWTTEATIFSTGHSTSMIKWKGKYQ